MEVSEVKSSSYALGPPWLFKGSALYQLHLVKADTARAFVPKELKLVEAFGYTLGGFFLAQYDDSPAGIFDELVVIAGLVWNPPTSCAWAGRVLVNSHEACRHGQKEVGLPSHVGLFSKKTTRITRKPIHGRNGFLDLVDVDSAKSKMKKHTEIQVSEIKDGSLIALCNISLPFAVPESKADKKWMGPRIRMSLPNFSGQTIHNPHLLKYSCQLECRVRVVEAAKISATTKIEPEKCSTDIKSIAVNKSTDLSVEDNAWNQSISVLLSKPILALEFNLLKMQVDMPIIVDTTSRKNLTGSPRIE